MGTDNIRKKYKEKTEQLAKELAEELLKNEADLEKKFSSFDSEVQEILLETGKKTMEIIGSTLEDKVKKKAVKEGLKIERVSIIAFTTVFGRVSVPSAYMWQRGTSCNTSTSLGVKHEGRSPAVDKALVDFGSDHSFEEAAATFERHYKFPISDSTVRRITESTGKEAEQFIQDKLAAYEAADGSANVD